jgi:uncharacterized protein YkwD
MKSLSYHNVLQQKVLHQNTPQRASVTRLGAVLATLLLASCGGGGKSYPETVAKEHIEPQLVTTVPAGVYTDPRSAAAFKRMNEIRAQAGIGLFRQNTGLDQAALGHSAYQVINAVEGHIEDPSMPAYFGRNHSDRMNKVNYNYSHTGRTEVTATGYKVSVANTPEAGILLVEVLMSAPYHRNEMLKPALADIGVGFYSDDKLTTTLTMDLGNTDANEQGAPENIAFVWPPNNSTAIFTQLAGRENPNPIPENGSLPAGYPASVHVNGEFRLITKVDKFEMRDPSGNLVNTKLLIPRDFVALIPRSPLAKNTRYTVNFEAETDEYRPVAIKKSWSFTTGDKTEY